MKQAIEFAIDRKTESISPAGSGRDRSAATGGVTGLVALVFAFALLNATPATAAILVVNCAAGPFFAINGAVAAAVNGDTIVVEACAAPYNENVLIAGFTGLHVVGVTPPDAAGGGGDFGAKPAGVGAAVNSLTVVSGAGLAGACFRVADSTDVKIQNFSIVNCTGGGVEVDASRQVLVLANRIINHPQAEGIRALNTEDLKIGSNLIGLTGRDGIVLRDTRLSTVVDNFIVRAGIEGAAAAGIRIIDGANNRVDNNDIRFSAAEGLIVSGVEARIERNSFLQNGGAADILVDNASNLADVVGNSVPAGINDLGAFTELSHNF